MANGDITRKHSQNRSDDLGGHLTPDQAIWTPRPDPTVLTTDQVRREIQMLRDVLETRLAGSDKAIELLQASTDKFPTFVKNAVNELKELHEEKFRSIAVQFVERDTRTEQTSRDSKVAVDAALQAAKEAVGEQNKSSALAIAKSEASTTKQIDQITVLIQSTAKGTDDKIDDLKTRMTAMEGVRAGGGASLAVVFSVVSALGSIVAILIALFVVLHK